MTKNETIESPSQAELDAVQRRATAELTDDELESVAGGKDVVVNNRRPGRPFRR